MLMSVHFRWIIAAAPIVDRLRCECRARIGLQFSAMQDQVSTAADVRRHCIELWRASGPVGGNRISGHIFASVRRLAACGR